MANTLFDVPAAPALPAIEGTPKQIPWAEDVRRKQLPAARTAFRAQQTLAELRERAGHKGAARERAKARRWCGALEALEQCASAREWIDARDLTPEELLNRFAGTD